LFNFKVAETFCQFTVRDCQYFLPRIVQKYQRPLNCFLQLQRITEDGAQQALNQEEAMRERNTRFTRIAIAIVVVFVICHVPRFIPNIAELLMINLPEVTFESFLIFWNNIKK
jgi:hypothetical protein